MNDFPTPPPVGDHDVDGITEIPPFDIKPDPSASHKLNEKGKVSKLFAPTREEKPPKVKSPTPSMPRPGVIAKRLEELYVGAGTMLVLADPVCGQAIMESAKDCAESVEQLCKENETVRRVVLKIIETSTLGKLFVAHMPILLAVSMHHLPAFRQQETNQPSEHLAEHLKGDEAA